MLRTASLILVVLGLPACGGDVCDAAVSDLAGTWTFTTGSGDKKDTITVKVRDTGSVTTTFDDGDSVDCDILEDDLCNLEVSCTRDSGDVFRFTLRKGN